MAEKKTHETVDAVHTEETNVTTADKLVAAKEANAKAAKATKEAAKANAEATAAVAKDTAKKTKKAAQEAAKKGSEAAKKGAEGAKKAAKKASEATKETAGKIKESTEATSKKHTKKPKRNVVLQYRGREVQEDELIDRAVAQLFATEGAVSVQKISLYIKPEEMKAYYVINDQYTGRVDF